MKALSVTIKQVKAYYTGSGTNRASWDNGGNLYKNLPLCISICIMLIENQQIERDLVNRALGTIKDFHWPKGTNINKDLPIILIAFNKYNSPYIN